MTIPHEAFAMPPTRVIFAERRVDLDSILENVEGAIGLGSFF